MKWVRRVHLYLGIALLPCVLLYGVTALLFNHSTWMTARKSVELNSDQLHNSSFATFPTAEAAAASAFDHIAKREGTRGLTFVTGSALWIGSLQFNTKTGAAEGRMIVDPQLRSAQVNVADSISAPTTPAWAEPSRLAGWGPMSKEMRTSLVEASVSTARSAGVTLDSATVRRLPELRFHLRDGEREYICDTTLEGELKVRTPEETGAWRERLLRLHLQHGNPGYFGARAIWAALVDVMGIAMILWAVSGIMMWWQIRNTRLTGFIALGAGISGIVVLAITLWHANGMA